MSEFFEQYFDFSHMANHFGEVLKRLRDHPRTCACGAVLALIWGLSLALLRQLPGKRFLPLRFLTIAYIDVFRGDPAPDHHPADLGQSPFLDFCPKAIRIPQWFGKPDRSGTASWP